MHEGGYAEDGPAPSCPAPTRRADAVSPPPRLAALAVVIHDDRVLLVRRRNEPDAGLWGFPGGHVEPGESCGECAAREAAEETGVIVHPRGLLTTVEVVRRGGSHGPGFHFVLAAVACNHVSGEPEAADDVSNARWVPIADVLAGQLPLSRHVEAVVSLAVAGAPAELLVDRD